MLLRCTLSLTCLVTACKSFATQGNQPVEWKACPTALAASGSRLRCAYYSVPLDWDFPDKGNITIGIAKIPASNPQNRIGNLFFNPGGPGVQSSGQLAIIDEGTSSFKVHQEILDRFDLIGVDIRGTGLSEPVTCKPQLLNDGLSSNWWPTDQASFDKLVRKNQAFRESCLNQSNRLVDYSDTISIAKDHEAVRKALGNELLSYLGASYGTLLGSQYAELFPDNIRAMVLDGVASNSPSEISLFQEGAVSVEATLSYFFDWCSKQNETLCPIAHAFPNETMAEVWRRILDRAESSPLPATICESQQCVHVNVTADAIRYQTLESMYTPSMQFPTLAQALYNASHGDASGFYAPLVSSRQTAYNTSRYYDNFAVSCQDYLHGDKSATDVQFKQSIAAIKTPLMKGMSTMYIFQHMCVGWPAPVRNPPHKIDIPRSENLPHILLVNALYDPATPYPMAVNLRNEIGKDRAALVTRAGAGHTTYFQPDSYDGSTVAAMNRYLLKLEVPEDGIIFDS